MMKRSGGDDEDPKGGRNVTFKQQQTVTKSNTISSDSEHKCVLDASTEFDSKDDLQSEASLGTHAKRLFEMHLTWRKNRSTPQNAHSSRIAEFVQSMPFRVFINFMILLNALQIGLAADRTDGDWEDIWRTCDIIFTTVFAVEMGLKLLAFGVTYFFDGWNCLDFFVAWSSIIDVWIIPSILGDTKDTPDILKLFRLCRLLRIVKMLRVVPELMLVVEGMVASLRSMFWVFLLLGIILYTVGIYCVEAIGSEGAGYQGYDNNEGYEVSVVEEFNNFLYFGTIMRSMVSLFGLVLLSEWSPVVRPVWEKQPAIVVVFIALVILTTFGVLNVIIGVVVERTTAAMNQVREKDVAKKKRDQTKAFQLISNLMFDLDTDHDKRVSKPEMERGAENNTLHELLQKVDFPHGFTYGEFHAMLDQDGSGYLSRSEFINGMLRLVYNDQFQRDCMFQLTMGQIKANQCKLHRETKTYIQQLYSGIKKEIASLRSDLHLAKPRKVQSMSSEGSDDVQSRRTSEAISSGISLGLKSLFPQADFTGTNSNKILVQPSLSEEVRQADSNFSVDDPFTVTGLTPLDELAPLTPSLAEMNATSQKTMFTEAMAASFSSNSWEPLDPKADPVVADADEDSVGVAQESSLLHEKSEQLKEGLTEAPEAFASSFRVLNQKVVDSGDPKEDEGCGGRLLARCTGREGIEKRYEIEDTNMSI